MENLAYVEDLEKLAEACLASAKTIKAYLADNEQPQPTFDQNGPGFFPHMSPGAEYARVQLRTASKTLYHLSSGPDEAICGYSYDIINDLNAFRYVNHFEIASAVPLNETISYSDLAAKSGTNEMQLKRIVRQLMMSHVFCEPKHGFVSHTASSKLLLHEGCAAWSGYVLTDNAPLAVNYVNAIEKWGHGSQEPTQTAHQIHYNTNDDMFKIFSNHPATAKRFNDLMTFVSSFALLDINHGVNGYDWSSLGKSTKVVDIGGNMGHCSLAFAHAAPETTFIIQDFESVVSRAQNPATSIIPEPLKDRITFMVHDAYDPQPIIGADIYFMRMVMHDLPDKYCAKILKNIVPAMRSNSRILIMDQVMPPVGGIPYPYERLARNMDLMMNMLLNATERELEEWEALFKSVDARLRIKAVRQPVGSVQSVIEVVLDEVDSV